MMNTKTQPVDDSSADETLTATEEARIKSLEKLGDKLEEANILYGSALDGMEPGLKEAAQRLEAYDVDGTMSKMEDVIAQKAADVISSDVEIMTDIEKELADDDDEEAVLLAEDESEPQPGA